MSAEVDLLQVGARRANGLERRGADRAPAQVQALQRRQAARAERLERLAGQRLQVTRHTTHATNHDNQEQTTGASQSLADRRVAGAESLQFGERPQQMSQASVTEPKLAQSQVAEIAQSATMHSKCDRCAHTGAGYGYPLLQSCLISSSLTSMPPDSESLVRVGHLAISAAKPGPMPWSLPCSTESECRADS